ncbi:MAG: hypothetical protein IKR98_06225 [Bacteroidaceae bacterium]|nr:hypothetical protein [Bacteroidaceae bacterium]
MNKKVLLFFVMALLSIMGAKADVIPSSYYSEPAAGTFYIYNVTEGKFLMTAGISENNKALQTTPQAVTLTSNGDGTYKFSGNSDCFVKIGYYGGMWLWPNGTSTNVLSWTFNAVGTKTYKISATTTSTVSENGSTKEAGTYYIINESNLGDKDDAANAGIYALITEANYYRYLASTTKIPSTYYTTTPSEGTYYLYNIEKNGFICDGNNYVGLQSTPAVLTLTSDGNGAFYIQVPDKGYIHTGYFDKFHVWADGATTTASGDYVANWTFESFHGVSGVFFIKSPEATVNGVTGNWHLHATGIANNGVNAWPTPDAYRTNYAWALISATDYPEWKNSNQLLSEVTGYSAETDVDNMNVSVLKSMTAGVWNTFVVPFDMTIPSGWTVKEPTEFDGRTLYFSDASSIEAGKPYIVNPTEAVTSFSATGVTLKKDLNNTTVGTGTTVTMTGTYSKIDAVENDSYIIGIKDGESALYKVNSTVSLKPFRAYFTVAGVAGVKANVIGLNFDYETNITEHFESIQNSECIMLNEAGAMFDLSGRRVSKAQKGLYIVNGKKVMVK